MQVGDLVIILGKLDTKIRDKNANGQLVYGTIEQFLSDGEVSVLLESGDIWIGKIRDIARAEDQK